jgi:hypothetical protein
VDAAVDRDGRELPGALVEERFEGGLVEHRRRRPPGRAVAFAPEAQQGRACAVAPFVDFGGLGDRTELGPDAAGLEDAAHLVVEVHRPGQGIGPGPALEHDHRPAEQDRQRVADRAVTDDGDVDHAVGVDHTDAVPAAHAGHGGHGGHGWRRGWWPQALMVPGLGHLAHAPIA